MGFFPVSIFFEFVVSIGLSLVLLQFDGVLPKVLAILGFIFGLSAAVGSQLWVVESSPGVLTLVILSPYPTLYVSYLIYLHLGLAYYGVAMLFRGLGRDPIGRSQEAPRA